MNRPKELDEQFAGHASAAADYARSMMLVCSVNRQNAMLVNANKF